MSDPREAAAMDDFIRHAAEPIGEAPEDRFQAEAHRAHSEDDVTGAVVEENLIDGTALKEEER